MLLRYFKICIKKYIELEENLLLIFERKKKVSTRTLIYFGFGFLTVLLFAQYFLFFHSFVTFSDVISEPLVNFEPISDLNIWQSLKKDILPIHLNETFRQLSTKIKAKAHNKRKSNFGCLRDGCRGLAIEDLLDRGWKMKFRSGFQNMSKEFKDLSFSADFYLTDTTTLNQFDKQRPMLFEKLIESQKYISAFIGGEAIGGNKGKQVRTKMKFIEQFGCKYNDIGLQPLQLRLYVKSECLQFLQIDKKENDLKWMLKPEEGSQGKGITLHSNSDSVANELRDSTTTFFPCKNQLKTPASQRYLVQEYIERPLLLKGSKFDLRVYMLIARAKPYLVFFHEGYLRRALSPYTTSTNSRRAFLTNTHFQSMRPDFKLSDHIWSFDTFQEYICSAQMKPRVSCYFVDTVLVPYLKSAAKLVFASAKPKLQERFGSFHVFGLDFMLDDNLAIHFLEANGYPGFTWSINFDSRQMVEEMFDLVLEVHEAPTVIKRMIPNDKFGNWQLVYNELYEDFIELKYNPCEEYKQNKKFFKYLNKASSRLYHKTQNKTLLLKQQQQQKGLNINVTLSGFDKFIKETSCGTLDFFIIESYNLKKKEECKSFLSVKDTKSPWIINTKNLNNVLVTSVDYIKEQVNYNCSSDSLSLIKTNNILITKLESNSLLLSRESLVKYDLLNEEIFPIETPESVEYIIQAYLFISSIEPLLFWYCDGFIKSILRQRTKEFDNLKQSDHILTFEDLNFYFSNERLSGSQFISTLLRPSIQNILKYLTKYLLIKYKNNIKKPILFKTSFILTKKAKLTLISIKIQNEIPKKLKNITKNLIFETKTSPELFIRMKEGDNFGLFQLIYSEIEDILYKNNKNCQKEKWFRSPNFEQLKNIGSLQDIKKKHTKSHEREMNKYVNKRWAYCKRKRNKDSQAECIRPTIELRYDNFLKKEHSRKDKDFIQNKIYHLQGLDISKHVFDL